MKPVSLYVAGACAALVAGAGAQAQTRAGGDGAVAAEVKARQAAEIRHGEPARWQQADTSRAARLRTLRKEIAAAYAEARQACRARPAAERADCLKEARATYEQDLAHAPDQLDAAPKGSVQTETVTTVVTPAARRP